MFVTISYPPGNPLIKPFNYMNRLKFMLSVVCLVSGMTAFGQATSIVTVKGTPYLDDSYVAGVIYYADKSLSAPVRYNAFKDLIEYQQGGKALVLDPTPTITKVKFGSSVFVPEKHESKLGYYSVLDSGKVTLYSRKKIRFLPGRKGGALDGSDQAPEYKPIPDVYYLKVGDGELKEVGNIKTIIEALPDKQEEMSEYAKKEKISPKKEREILQLIQYYNSL